MKGPSGNREAVIEARGVTRRFKDVLAVNHIDMEIFRGEYTALLGPNGAGKTTLVEMIEGLQHPDAGSIRILGRPWKGNESSLRRVLGISLQETRFMDRVTVEETIDLFGSFYHHPESRSEEILDLVDLAEKRKSYVMNLSGGQRQKLALGVALINEPEILILDEPTTGLDPNARREIWDLLHRLRARGTTLILTTHYMEEAENLCSRILIMHRGRFLAEGTLSELLASHGSAKNLDDLFVHLTGRRLNE